MTNGTGWRTARERLARITPLVVTGLVPTIVIAIANARFTYNHFYARAPYLLDSGWCSAIVYRAGVIPNNPPIACDYATSYYGVHVSPFTSLFSLLSYFAPMDRVEWYALYQAIVYAPFGLTAYFVTSRLVPVSRWRLPLTMLTALAFAFSGQLLMCMFHPHYEAVIAGLICLLLASVVTGRRRVAWGLLLLVVTVREDAGFHAALMLGPLAYLKLRRVDVNVTWRGLGSLAGFAFMASLVGMATQRVFFHSADLLRAEYLGTPVYAHISPRVLAERLSWLVTACPFISVPFLATVLVAAVRRDARYLLGWVASTPWLIVNALASQQAKWVFGAYTGFPFLVGFFWMYLYGAWLAPAERKIHRSHLEATMILASVVSTFALYIQRPTFVESLAHGMFQAEPADRHAVRAYGRLVRERGSTLGRIAVDQAAAALALETLDLEDAYVPGRRNFDTLTFHRDNLELDARLFVDLAALEVPRCAHVLSTGFFFCSRGERAALRLLPTEPVPALLAFARFDNPHQVTFAPRGAIVQGGHAPGIVLTTRPLLARLVGEYEVVFDLSSDELNLGRVDVALDGVVVGSAFAPGGQGRRERTSVRFDVQPNQTFEARLWHDGHASLTIEGAELRAVPLAEVAHGRPTRSPAGLAPLPANVVGRP